MTVVLERTEGDFALHYIYMYMIMSQMKLALETEYNTGARPVNRAIVKCLHIHIQHTLPLYFFL